MTLRRPGAQAIQANSPAQQWDLQGRQGLEERTYRVFVKVQSRNLRVPAVSNRGQLYLKTEGTQVI